MQSTVKKRMKGFGYGWGLQVQVGLMFFFFAALTNDMQNIIVGYFVEHNSWSHVDILNVATWSGWAGVIGTIFIAYLVSRKGNRFAIVTSLLGCGIFALFLGHTSNLALYAILSCIVFFFAFSFGAILTGSLTANWFPRTRGYVLGWSSIGMPLSTCLFTPAFAFVANSIGVAYAITLTGVLCIILGIVSIFWVKNTPEEIGLYPDGDDSNLEELETTRKAMSEYKSPWTIKRLLRCPTVWTQSLCYGLLFLVTIGVLGQWIPRMTQEIGYDISYALMMLSSVAFIGIIGSIIWGWIDSKVGTKKATIGLAIWYTIAVFLLIIGANSLVLTWIGVAMIGSSIGGIGNIAPSMLIQTFGRWDFAAASRVVNTVTNFIRASAFAVVALGIGYIGSISGAYNILLGCAIVAVILAFNINDKLIGKEG